MRALEKYLGLSGLNFNAEKKIAHHQERVAQTKSCVDTSAPKSLHERENMSPGKRHSSKIERNRLIALNNMLLARRIFSIMDTPGMIHEDITDTRHLDSHAGTMNFKSRLEEAQRIHRNNQHIATRLDSVKGVLTKKDLRTDNHFNPLQAMVQRKKKKMKRMELQQKKMGHRVLNWDDTPIHTHRSENGESGRSPRGRMAAPNQNNGSQSARRAESPTGSKHSGGSTSRPRPVRILLEYTKIQDGKVLDIAVIKIPLKDRFAVFGIDIDGGQRYELQLSSEDIASILDADMLVTNIDSLEVWVAVLNKATLSPVSQFSQIPASENPEDIIRHTASRQGRGGMKPAPPSSRPPSKPASSRPGSRVKDAEAAESTPTINPTTPTTRASGSGERKRPTPGKSAAVAAIPLAAAPLAKNTSNEKPTIDVADNMPAVDTRRRPSLVEVEDDVVLRPATELELEN